MDMEIYMSINEAGNDAGEEPGVQSAFQFIRKVFSRVQIRALCHLNCFIAVIVFVKTALCTVSLQRVATRAFSTTARQMKNRVPEKQKLFQEDNGLPIHIKGGSTDMVLYRITMTLTIVGTAFSCYWLLVASMPRSKAE